jgi:hypothetical protein
MPVSNYAVRRRHHQRGGNFKGKKYQRGKQDGGFLGKLFGMGGSKQKAQPINLNVNQRQSNSMNVNRRNGSMYYGPRSQPYHFRQRPYYYQSEPPMYRSRGAPRRKTNTGKSRCVAKSLRCKKF